MSVGLSKGAHDIDLSGRGTVDRLQPERRPEAGTKGELGGHLEVAVGSLEATGLGFTISKRGGGDSAGGIRQVVGRRGGGVGIRLCLEGHRAVGVLDNALRHVHFGFMVIAKRKLSAATEREAEQKLVVPTSIRHRRT
jgi:hypothetical protein